MFPESLVKVKVDADPTYIPWLVFVPPAVLPVPEIEIVPAPLAITDIVEKYTPAL